MGTLADSSTDPVTIAEVAISGTVRKKDNVSPPAQMTTAEHEEFKKWKESAGANERSEFEEWRAWQEWKRKNPK